MAIGFVAVPPGIAAFKAVRSEQLPDATTQVSIMQRVGGATGGALFAIALANNQASGQLPAFHDTFRWLIGAAALTVTTSYFLHRFRPTR